MCTQTQKFQITQVPATPLLQNTIQSLSSSIPWAPSSYGSNIADLHKSKRFTHKAKYQEEDIKKEQPLEVDNNEALPGLLQKKISKVLRKLQLISQLARSIVPKPTEKYDPDFDVDFDENDNVDNTTRTDDFDTKTPPNDNEDVETVDEEQSSPTGTFQLSPRAIGVYFTDIVGSLIGLIYGIAGQLSNSNSSEPLV